MTIGLGHYLSVAAILFTLGIFGIFLNRKNVIIILMSIELILLAVNINLVAFSTHLGDKRFLVRPLAQRSQSRLHLIGGRAVTQIGEEGRCSVAIGIAQAADGHTHVGPWRHCLLG